ncbi:hypothetical protein LWI28_027920 [Acer negundo]|uniref:Aspartate/glutamate/uridylate kinase domain-containing protein n=1 Tax=Acer negundo TaxID=4023 RepID=A0AAD5IGU6_ACENE|nr:hypothetical protein LWI28_027920 [Acer negundo]
MERSWKYGRVPDDVRPSAGQALYRFKVETAPGVIDSLLSSQVFSLRSMLMGDEASTATIPEDINSVTDTKSHHEIRENSRRGKTMTSQAGEKAVSCGVINASCIEELNFIKELHFRTSKELERDSSIIAIHLEEPEQLLKGIAIMKELTSRTRDYLVSFGECMSTRIFAAYLNRVGVKTRQYDAFDIGFITTYDFTNADILEATYPAFAKRLHGDWISDPAIPIGTGFLGKGCRSCAITTLGRGGSDLTATTIGKALGLEEIQGCRSCAITKLGGGGSDLTATTIGKALGLEEIQAWKDVNGVLTCDPNIYQRAELVPYLTFDEEAELSYFWAQSVIVFNGASSSSSSTFNEASSSSSTFNGASSSSSTFFKRIQPSSSSSSSS